jgi:hypothetical protein
MERRFAVWMRELMAGAVVEPAVFAGMLARLEQFVEPFAARLKRGEQRVNAQHYVAGLLSNVERKNVESVAYHQHVPRLPPFVTEFLAGRRVVRRRKTRFPPR